MKFLYLSIEWWKLIVQFVTGTTAAIAVIFASNVAIKWSRRQSEKEEKRNLRYYRGLFKLLESGICFYFRWQLGDGRLEDQDLDSGDVLNELEGIIYDINENKYLISGLFPQDYDIHSFFDLMLMLRDLIVKKNVDPDEKPEIWGKAEKQLEEIVGVFDRELGNKDYH